MKNKVLAIDIELEKGISYGTSYFQLPRNVKEYLDRMFDRHGILGFEYDRNSDQFGIVLKEENASV